ncbi:MAG: ABC transporter substrate-binding protein [Propionibacteriaceae bacterium]|nr:ABC transporter substrate-binding protein [Propionibacteriaceae bacterium]
MKRALTAALAVGLLFTTACAGGGSGSSNEGSTTPESIYFLNFKPEVAEVYEKIAADYKAETGTEVKVVTAASGTYEQTLASEIAKSDPPTIFQINGPIGYSNWKDYTADLTSSKLYEALKDKSMAISGDDGGIYGIPYVVEGYGIIYNDAIMSKYFALSDKKATISKTEDIKDFATLKTVVEDMQSHADDLGIKGVFSNTSLKPGEDWRWQTHLADVPFYHEFKDAGELNASKVDTVQFTYNEQFKNLFDLYLNNSTTDKAQLGSKTVDESMAEFALGQSAMVQNGNWGWNQVNGNKGNTVKADDVKFLPLYMGFPDEASQGLCIGTENYFAINKEVSEAKQQASLDFLYWLFSSDKGKKYVTDELGFIAPFTTFTSTEVPSGDPLAKEVSAWMEKPGVTSVPWVFQLFPSQNFKDEFGGALLQYAQGKEQWPQVVSDVVDTWKTEAAAAQ